MPFVNIDAAKLSTAEAEDWVMPQVRQAQLSESIRTLKSFVAVANEAGFPVLKEALTNAECEAEATPTRYPAIHDDGQPGTETGPSALLNLTHVGESFAQNGDFPRPQEMRAALELILANVHPDFKALLDGVPVATWASGSPSLVKSVYFRFAQIFLRGSENGDVKLAKFADDARPADARASFAQSVLGLAQVRVPFLFKQAPQDGSNGDTDDSALLAQTLAALEKKSKEADKLKEANARLVAKVNAGNRDAKVVIDANAKDVRDQHQKFADEQAAKLSTVAPRVIQYNAPWDFNRDAKNILRSHFEMNSPNPETSYAVLRAVALLQKIQSGYNATPILVQVLALMASMTLSRQFRNADDDMLMDMRDMAQSLMRNGERDGPNLQMLMVFFGELQEKAACGMEPMLRTLAGEIDRVRKHLAKVKVQLVESQSLARTASGQSEIDLLGFAERLQPWFQQMQRQVGNGGFDQNRGFGGFGNGGAGAGARGFGHGGFDQNQAFGGFGNGDAGGGAGGSPHKRRRFEEQPTPLPAIRQCLVSETDCHKGAAHAKALWLLNGKCAVGLHQMQPTCRTTCNNKPAHPSIFARIKEANGRIANLKQMNI